MKVATLDLTPELFIEWCKNAKDGPPRKLVVKENPLPDDAEIYRVGLSPGRHPLTLRLFITSESFVDVAGDAEPPELPLVIFSVVYDEVSELVA